MKRFHLFEFVDLPYWPELFRCFLTEYLRALLCVHRPFGKRIDLLVDAMKAGEDRQIIDLCSGGAGRGSRLELDRR